MLIKKYEIERPDSDGECSIDLEFKIKNNHDDDVMLIKYDAFHLNEKGYLITSDIRNSSQCFLEPGDAEELSGWGRTHERYLTNGSSVTVQVQSRVFKREFFKLGTFNIPESEGVTWLDANVESLIIDNNIKISMTRFEPDDDGEIRIEFMAYIKNQTYAFLEDAELKISLLDRAGAEIESTSSTNDLPPHSATGLEPSIWGVKPKKLKGASAEISITIYEQIGAEVIEGTTQFSL
jgi:hypothetical protein